jgi:hypothetical protein
LMNKHGKSKYAAVVLGLITLILFCHISIYARCSSQTHLFQRLAESTQSQHNPQRITNRTSSWRGGYYYYHTYQYNTIRPIYETLDNSLKMESDPPHITLDTPRKWRVM